jgi:hypothetical protein
MELRFHIRDRYPLWQPGDLIDLAEIETDLRARGYDPESITPLEDGTIVVQVTDAPPRQAADLGPIERAAWLADSPEFIRRVRMVLFKVAVEVQIEQSSVAYHAARSQLAYEALRDPDRFARLFAAAAAANDDAMRNAAFTDPANPNQVNVTDAAILAAVRQLWTPFAVDGA